jgi:hypothetical protein
MKRSTAKRINYSEGTCFFVPLRNGGFARGVVTRLSGNGEIFAYFFGPKLTGPEASFDDVRAENALLSGRCGDLGLLKGEWPLAGHLNNWNRNDWPLPALYREDAEAQKAWLSYYDNNDLKFLREESVDYRQAQYTKYPYDRLMGYGAVEIRITKLLA